MSKVLLWLPIMHNLTVWVDLFLQFLERGGIVQASILCVSVLMWSLIVQRYLFLSRRFPQRLHTICQDWAQRQEHRSWYAHRIREGMLAELSAELHQYLLPLRTLTSILPMLGLLGTVAGMVNTFDVMSLSGTNNVRGMAGGISQAMLTTLAGLVTALSGMYFVSNLEHRAQFAVQKAAQSLTLVEDEVAEATRDA